jgi:hypothetical protein
MDGELEEEDCQEKGRHVGRPNTVFISYTDSKMIDLRTLRFLMLCNLGFVDSKTQVCCERPEPQSKLADGEGPCTQGYEARGLLSS